jgi:hypothetical protein
MSADSNPFIEALVDIHQTTRHHIPEDRNLDTHRFEDRLGLKFSHYLHVLKLSLKLNENLSQCNLLSC